MSAQYEAAKKKLEQAQARFQKAQTLERQRQRKLDARQKIIIGAAMLKMIDTYKDPDRREKTVQTILRFVSDKDRPLIIDVLRGGDT